MIEIVLHDDAFDELLNAFIDTGVCADDAEMLARNQFTVQDITFKLWEYIPTPEQIERNRQFAESPLGKITAEMFKRTSEKFAADLLSQKEDAHFFNGKTWPPETKLRIRLPNDYQINPLEHEQSK